jgi:hypothetical protein
MTKGKNLVERRRHKRMEVRDGAFVLLGPDSTKLGRMIDISLGGLAFSHMARERPSNELFELDMFIIDGDFYLERVPFETISDLKTLENPFSSITMRRSGVRFGELTHDQLSLLENFIQNHTMGRM